LADSFVPFGGRTNPVKEKTIMKSWKNWLHPLNMTRLAGYADGTTLLLLLGVAMPLKYWADLPLAVTIVGSIHGWVFIVYLMTVLYAQLRLQWHVKWTLFSVAAGFVPFANYALNHALNKRRDRFEVKPIPKIWLVYAIVFFTFIDLFTQLPVMSTFAASLGATAMLSGFAVGMYSLSNMAGNVLSGKLTDKYGAYIVLCVGLLSTAVALVLYRVVDSVPALLAVRFLHGLVSGLITPAAFTYVANETRREKQGSRTAITGSFVGMAAIIGPAYSGIMANRFSVPFVFTTVAAVGLGLFLLTVQVLRTGHAAEKERKRPPKLRLNRGMVQAFAGAFFLMVSQGALAYLLPFHVEALGYNSRLSGTLLSMFGIVAVLLFLLPTNRMFDRKAPDLIVFAGLAVLGVCQLLLGRTEGMALLYAVMALYGIGFALLFPSMNTLLIRSTEKENRGLAYGVFYALFSIGTVAGSSGLGLIPASLVTLFTVTGSLLIVCALAVLVVSLHARRVNRNLPAVSSGNDRPRH
jgi:integral membrane protein